MTRKGIIVHAERVGSGNTERWSWRFDDGVRGEIEDLLDRRGGDADDNPLPCDCEVFAVSNDDGVLTCLECDGSWPRDEVMGAGP